MKFKILKTIFVLMTFLLLSFQCFAEQSSETLMAMEAGQDAAVEIDRPIPRLSWTAENKVWLARSCVGEAGFWSVEECFAIAWVYAKRSKETGRSFSKIMRKYSSAIKAHEMHRRPWLFGLNIDGSKPRAWPKNLSWKRYKTAWIDLLAALDRWADGEAENKFPNANHYGSRQDARRAYYVTKWKRIDVPPEFSNWFFDSTKKTNFNVARKRKGGNG